jgi:hypothetical protein
MTQKMNLSVDFGETWLLSFPYTGAQAMQSATFRIATRQNVARGDVTLNSGISRRPIALDVNISPGQQRDFGIVNDTYIYELRATLDDGTVDTVFLGSLYVEKSPFGYPDPTPPGSGGILDFYDPDQSGLLVLLEDI